MPHRLMKLPLDPSHLEMPVNIVLAVAGSTISLAVAAWQFMGSLIAQLPTPDKVSGWQERDVYLCAAIIFAFAIVVMARWIAVKMLQAQADNSKALQAVAAALEQWDKRMDTLVNPAVQHAMDAAFTKDPSRALAAPLKRHRQDA